MIMKNEEHSIGGSIKRAGGVVLYVAIAAIVGYLLLVLAYCLPVSWMQDNIKESATLIARETDADHRYYMADNLNDLTTDSFMLLAAVHEDSESPWQAAADIMIDEYQGQMPQDVLIAEYQDGMEPDSEFSYGRYWHGYLILLKPILCLFDYGQIRYLMAACQLVLLFLVLSRVQQRLGMRYALALLGAYIVLNPITTMDCMQYNVVALLTLFCLLVLMWRADYWLSHDYQIVLLFCTFGLLTSYFDLLTYPLLTLGLPLLTWVALRLQTASKGHLWPLILNSIAWGVGYGGMWAMKWVYGSLVLGREMFSEALYNIEKRTSTSMDGVDDAITYINVLKCNVADVSVVAILACVVILLIILLYGKGMRRIAEWKSGWYLLAVAIYPLLWYAAVKNHSYIHSWFTFRNLAIGVYGGLLFAAFIKEHN